MPPSDRRRLCLIFLKSIGDGLRWLLPMSDLFYQRYDLLSYVSYESTANYGAFSRDLISRCDVLLCHSPDAVSFADQSGYQRFLDDFPASTRKIFIGCPRFAALWPFHIDDGPCLPLPLYQPFWPEYQRDGATMHPAHAATVRGELPFFPFGDSYVESRFREGLSPSEIFSNYMNLDVASVVDLDALAKKCLTDLARGEDNCDTKIADFVATTFQSRKLFGAPDLAGNLLILQIANATLKELDLPPLAERILDQLQPFIKIEAPIHPSIGRFFGASYIGGKTRYLVDRHRSMTFAEYMQGYVDWLAADDHRTPAALPSVPAEMHGFE